MQKLIETLNNTVKLISSLATLAVLGGLVYGVLWVRHQYAVLTEKPIQLPSVKLPDVQLPAIKMEAPEIKLKAPTLDLSGLLGGKKNENELKELRQREQELQDKSLAEMVDGVWRVDGVPKLDENGAMMGSKILAPNTTEIPRPSSADIRK